MISFDWSSSWSGVTFGSASTVVKAHAATAMYRPEMKK